MLLDRHLPGLIAGYGLIPISQPDRNCIRAGRDEAAG